MKEKCTRSNTTPCCPWPQLSHPVSPQLSQTPSPFSCKSPSRTAQPQAQPFPCPFWPSILPPVLSVRSLLQVTEQPRCEADSWQGTFLTSRLWQAAASHRNESSVAQWRVCATCLQVMLLPGSDRDLGHIQSSMGAQTVRSDLRKKVWERFGAQESLLAEPIPSGSRCASPRLDLTLESCCY